MKASILDAYLHSDDGIAPGEAIDCFNPNGAAMKAEVAQAGLRRRACIQPQWGVRRWATSATPKLIRKFGEVPDDLSAL